MKQEKQDRRSRRTRNQVIAAMMDLMLEKTYDAITVQDLLDRANIGRSTFYSHYYDKEDVLSSLGEQMLEMLGQLSQGEASERSVMPAEPAPSLEPSESASALELNGQVLLVGTLQEHAHNDQFLEKHNIARTRAAAPIQVPELLTDATVRSAFEALAASSTFHEALERLGGEPRALLERLAVEDLPWADDPAPYAISVLVGLVEAAAGRRLATMVRAGDDQASRLKQALEELVEARSAGVWAVADRVATQLLPWVLRTGEE